MNVDFNAQLQTNMSRTPDMERAAKTISNRLFSAEQELILQMSKGENASATVTINGKKEKVTGEAAIQALRGKFERFQRIFEVFDKLMERKHDMLMRLISRIGGR